MVEPQEYRLYLSTQCGSELFYYQHGGWYEAKRLPRWSELTEVFDFSANVTPSNQFTSRPVFVKTKAGYSVLVTTDNKVDYVESYDEEGDPIHGDPFRSDSPITLVIPFDFSLSKLSLPPFNSKVLQELHHLEGHGLGLSRLVSLIHTTIDQITLGNLRAQFPDASIERIDRIYKESSQSLKETILKLSQTYPDPKVIREIQQKYPLASEKEIREVVLMKDGDYTSLQELSPNKELMDRIHFETPGTTRDLVLQKWRKHAHGSDEEFLDILREDQVVKLSLIQLLTDWFLEADLEKIKGALYEHKYRLLNAINRMRLFFPLPINVSANDVDFIHKDLSYVSEETIVQALSRSNSVDEAIELITEEEEREAVISEFGDLIPWVPDRLLLSVFDELGDVEDTVDEINRRIKRIEEAGVSQARARELYILTKGNVFSAVGFANAQRSTQLNEDPLHVLCRQLYGLPVVLPSSLAVGHEQVEFISLEKAKELEIAMMSLIPIHQIYAGPPGTRNRIVTLVTKSGEKFLVKATLENEVVLGSLHPPI